jgi:uncharacterized membrane protein YphA (DoxX/SURF4 family)
MNAALWIVQGLLAALFGVAGIMKIFMTKNAQKMWGWAADRPVGFVRFVGTADILGAIGILFPEITGILPLLTPVAAIGLIVIQLLAIFTVHIPRKELNALPFNVLLLAMAVFAAVGRWALI